MIQVKCNQVEHQESPIQALCLRKECKQNSAYCARCVKLHPDCANHLKFLDEVPAATSQLKSMRDHFRDAFKFIIKKITQLEQIVNEHFSSIDQLTSNPTLTNLNKLGQLLKESKPFDIPGFDRWKNSILQNLDQFRQILYEGNFEQIKQRKVVVLPNKNQDQVKKYIEAGKQLDDNGQHSQAIECYNKAIEIDQDNCHLWYYIGNHQLFLGKSLMMLEKFQQAIECFNKCIKIDPRQNTVYYFTGLSLQLLKRYQEAIKYYDEQNKLGPDIYSYCQKGKSLELLSRWKDAEHCYIEAIKYFPSDLSQKFEDKLLDIQSKKR